MKILTIVGARPQFIKAAAVSQAIRDNDAIIEVVVHTGQHYDPSLSDIFFNQLSIPKPKINLQIGSSRHGEQTGRMLAAIEQVIIDEEPDWLLVYGDTNSTLAGAVAAAKLHVPVAHVEAGLRSFNRRMPEEVNRILTDHASTLLFTPTETAAHNLTNEGISEAQIREVGDVMYDAVQMFAPLSSREGTLERLALSEKNYVLATVHRAENTDAPKRLRAILNGLDDVATHIPVVLPLHPRTLAYIKNGNYQVNNIQFIEPVGYLEMLQLEAGARLIATDSGGVQKEAYFHRVPCVTLRDETEWVELVESGWNLLQSPVSSAAVSEAVLSRLGTTGNEVNLYGGGNARTKIISQLLTFKLGDGTQPVHQEVSK